MALRELSAQLEAPKSSLLPLLRALTARGYLEQDPLGEYRLGPEALERAAPPRPPRVAESPARAAGADAAYRGDGVPGHARRPTDRGGVRGQGRERAGHPVLPPGSATAGRCTPPRAARRSGVPAVGAREVLLARCRSVALHRAHRDEPARAARRARGDARDRGLREPGRAGCGRGRRSRRRSSTATAAWPAPARSAGPPTAFARGSRQLAAEVKDTARGISSLLGHRPHDDRRPAGRTQ